MNCSKWAETQGGIGDALKRGTPKYHNSTSVSTVSNPVRETVKTTTSDDLNGNWAESVERRARKKKTHVDAVRLDPATAL